MNHSRKSHNRIWLLTLALVALLTLVPAAIVAQEDTAEDGSDHMMADVIDIERPGLFPEGIEYDAERDRFLVGSLSEGTIYAVHGDGDPTPFIEDPNIASSVGIQIDSDRDRLLVVSSNTFVFMDPTLPYNAELAAYDLETGERIFFADLAALTAGGPNVANDVAVDADGNAYVTDSLAPVIYRVDTEGEAAIFWQDSRFDGAGEPALNGIEYHPDGYLLVPARGRLYRVPVDDPGDMTEVELDQPISAADGIILHPDGRLIVVQGQVALVTALRSDDDWTTATTVGTAETDMMGTATTAAIRDEDVYVVYSHILSILQGDEPPQVFEIVRVDFNQD